MNYVFLIHAAEARFATMSQGQVEDLMQGYGAYTRELFSTGRAGDCAALESIGTATTVQLRDGKRIVKDGPFAETREQLGGYYAFDAQSEDEALAWAAKIPDATNGHMEVRPITFAPPSAQPDAQGRQQYLFLIYEPATAQSDLSHVSSAYLAFNEGLHAKGQFIAGARLDSFEKARSVQVARGERVVKDGPFADTREQLGGYYRVFAKDLDEAIALAARIPAAETGSVEIRPIRDTSKYA